MTAADVVAHIEAMEESERPRLVGVSLTTRQWLRARDLIGDIRARIDIPVIAGGLHPTFSPEAVLDSPGFDYVCLGEGEAPMLDLVDSSRWQGETHRRAPRGAGQGGSRCHRRQRERQRRRQRR